MIVLDVGANEGQTALGLNEAFRDIQVHSFEPVAATFSKLERNIASFSNISAHHLALGATCGSANMLVGENPFLNRLDSGKTASNDFNASESVPIQTIDAFCLEHAIAHVNLLKIDVEGAEPAVIQGATNMLTEGKVDFAFVEIGFDALDAGHAYAPEVIRLLNERGLRLYGIYDYCRLIPPEYVHYGRLPVFANALFAKA